MGLEGVLEPLLALQWLCLEAYYVQEELDAKCDDHGDCDDDGRVLVHLFTYSAAFL